MVIKIRCTDTVGKAIIGLVAAIELIGADYKPEDLQFEVLDDDSVREGGGGPRTQYWAKLPKLPDGKFDMAAVDDTVKQNLRSLGAHTVNGIIYNDIVQVTLNGEKATEPALRKARMMKGGSSQRAVQQLFHMGMIDRGPISKEPSNG